MGRVQIPAGHHVRDADFVLRVGRQRAVGRRRIGVEHVDVVEQRLVPGVDLGNLHKRFGTMIGAAIHRPRKPQRVAGQSGAGDARVGAVQPAAPIRGARRIPVPADPAGHPHRLRSGRVIAFRPGEHCQRARVLVRREEGRGPAVLRHAETLPDSSILERPRDHLAAGNRLERNADHGRAGGIAGAEKIGRDIQAVRSHGQVGKSMKAPGHHWLW